MKNEPKKPILLIALGGNALIRKGQAGTTDEQMENLRVPARQIAELSQTYRIIVTHGNGPQVGNLLLQQECCPDIPKLPLEILVAQTEGQIGFMIESTLDEAFMDMGIEYRPLVSLITYVVVDKNDPAFENPSKPIGPVYSADEAARLDYPTVLTAKGYRRVVASPRPITIVEKREIRQLMENDFIVICCGGGGIPVTREGRMFHGVDAVIDKDLASLCLASEIDADHFLIATDVDAIYLNFGKPEQRRIDALTIEAADQYLADGQFPAGSMAPKVKAATGFIRQGGKKSIITSVDRIISALAGQSGTVFYREDIKGD